MRKKSAFLEKLTARAAAAFEADGSLDASNGQSAQDHDSTPSPRMPVEKPKTHEKAVSDSTTCESVSTPLTSAVHAQIEPQVKHTPLLAHNESPARITVLPKKASQEKTLASELQEVQKVQKSLEKTKMTHALVHEGNEQRLMADVQGNAVAGQVNGFAEPSRAYCTKVFGVHCFEKNHAQLDVVLGTELSTQLDTELGVQIQKRATPTTNPDSDEERVCASLGNVAKILFAHLITMEKNVLNMKKLHLYNQNKALISYSSIRTAWGRLKDLRIVSYSARHDIGKDKGVLFQLDGSYTFAFQKLYPHMLDSVGTEQDTQLNTYALPHADYITAKTKLEVHPEYDFWREYGLSQTQCEHWKQEFGLDDLLLDNYLRWCAYDIGHGERKDKSGKTISNPTNWFYSILKKAGSYPKPEGYQSHEEKMFIVREHLLQEQTSLQARQSALRAQEERQEAEALFLAFLEEGEDSPQYQELCKKVSPFLYENRRTRRRLFENALRAEYFAFLGINITA